MAVKAHIYAEDGGLLGFIAYNEEPPNILELNGRFFKHHGVSQESDDEDECNVMCYDYWEIEVEDLHEDISIIPICIGCGRNASLVWHKCCPEHLTLDGQEVYCQSCVEILHPNDPDFLRE